MRGGVRGMLRAGVRGCAELGKGDVQGWEREMPQDGMRGCAGLGKGGDRKSVV